MFTKLLFHCERSLSGKIFNSDIGHKNGVTIEELLLNNYSFKRSGFFVRSIFVKEFTTPGGIAVSILIKHDKCPLEFLVSFARSIISRCDIGEISIKTCESLDFYFGSITLGNSLLTRICSSRIVSIFCEYFSFLMIGHGFPEKILLDQDLRAQNAKGNGLINQVIDKSISVYQLSITNIKSFNLVIRHDRGECDSGGFGVSTAAVYNRNNGELADTDKITSSIDIVGPLFMSIAASFLSDWTGTCNNKDIISEVCIA